MVIAQVTVTLDGKTIASAEVQYGNPDTDKEDQQRVASLASARLLQALGSIEQVGGGATRATGIYLIPSAVPVDSPESIAPNGGKM